MAIIASRFFSKSLIPRPAQSSAKFVYNYFVPDEAENETGFSNYDDGQFANTSYSMDGSAYLLDDQGNKLIRDNFGNLVGEDVIQQRSPRFTEVTWTPSEDTGTQPLGDVEDLKQIDTDGLLIRQEDISSVLDTQIKVFDPQLRKRLDTKLKLMHDLSVDPTFTFGSWEAYYDTGVHYTETGIGTMQLMLDYLAGGSSVPNRPTNTVTETNANIASLIDLNKSTDVRKVNDLGVDVEVPVFEDAASILLDVKYDRRLLDHSVSNNMSRKYFSSRQVKNYTNVLDAENLPSLPAESDPSGASLSTGDTRFETITDQTPYLKSLAKNQEAVSPMSQIDLVGYIVERYDAKKDINLNTPERSFYVNSAISTSLIDTQIAYGSTYYYMVRSVYMRDFTGLDITTGQILQQRQFFASYPTDPMFVEAVESTPPKEPDGLFYKFNYTGKKGLILTWQYPVGRQRDTKYFQVFRRKTIHDPFTCIAELDFNNATVKMGRMEKVHESQVIPYAGTTTFYEDIHFTRDSSYIYTIAAIDAHGLSSAYSAQTLVTFDKDTNKIKLKAISRSGAPKQYPNFFIDPDLDENTYVRTLTQDVMTTSGKSKVRLYFDSDCEMYRSTTDDGVEETYTHTGLTENNIVYKLHMINLDRQKDDSVEITFKDFRNK